jgi:hypothetical protein
VFCYIEVPFIDSDVLIEVSFKAGLTVLIKTNFLYRIDRNINNKRETIFSFCFIIQIIPYFVEI